MPSKLFGTRTAQLPHLVRQGKLGIPGEIGDLREDVEEALEQLEGYGGLLMLEEFTNLVAADPDGIKTSFATSASQQVFTHAASDLNGVVGGAEMVPPRNPTVTSSNHADVNAVAVVFVGKIRDATGKLVAQSVTVNVTDNGNTTDVGAKALSIVEQVTIPAMAGTGGALQLGFGNVVGLKKKVRSAAGLPVVAQQITDGALVTNGTFVAAATATPHGTWSPNTAPNAAHDYAIFYAIDNS